MKKSEPIWTPLKFERAIERIIGEPVQWRWNTNENSIISVTRQRARPRFKVSIHAMFLDAPRDFLPHVAAFIRRPTLEARAAVRRFINQNSESILPREWHDSPDQICPRGRVYDLAAMARRVNDAYFKGKLRYTISWGRWGARRARPRSFSSIQLGSYNERRRLIRIHPILDTRDVPSYFLEYIIYHEMLHIVCPPKVLPSGRMEYHSREFRRLEQQFHAFKRSMQWESDQLPRLLARSKNA